MFHRNIHVIFLSILTLSNCLRKEFEPVCSKYHYEEQLLEKMIRIEVKFETLLDNVEKLETSIKEERRLMSEERIAGKQQIQDWINNKDSDVTSFIEKINLTFEDNERKLIRLSNEFMEVQNRSIGEINDMAMSLKQRSVAFEAHVVPKQNPGKGEKIIFTNTKLNEGDGYDNTTGTFTVPEGGIYLIMVQFCLRNSKYMHFDILRNSVILLSSKFYRGGSGNYACYSTQAAVKASIGDEIWLEGNHNHPSDTLFESRYFVNSFTCVLIK